MSRPMEKVLGHIASSCTSAKGKWKGFTICEMEGHFSKNCGADLNYLLCEEQQRVDDWRIAGISRCSEYRRTLNANRRWGWHKLPLNAARLCMTFSRNSSARDVLMCPKLVTTKSRWWHLGQGLNDPSSVIDLRRISLFERMGFIKGKVKAVHISSCFTPPSAQPSIRKCWDFIYTQMVGPVVYGGHDLRWAPL